MRETTCQLCNQPVKCTHKMQTLRAQFIAHLRISHKMTVNQAKIEANKQGINQY